MAKCSDPAPQMETKCVPTLMSKHSPSLFTAKSRPILDECRSCRRGHHGTFVRPFMAMRSNETGLTIDSTGWAAH